MKSEEEWEETRESEKKGGCRMERRGQGVVAPQNLHGVAGSPLLASLAGCQNLLDVCRQI